jgi:site-specific recombinase XerD
LATTSRERQNREQQLEKHLQDMPFYVVEYVRDKKRAGFSPSTLLYYVLNYRRFFQWLIAEGIADVKHIKDMPLETLEKLRKKDVLYFIDYLKEKPFEKKKKVLEKRKPDSVMRPIHALKSLFNYLTTETEDENGECYFYRNVLAKIETHKEKETANRRARKISSGLFKGEEIKEFLDFLKYEYENTLTPHQKKYFQRDKERDIAIISLLLGSGARVDEIANLMLNDIDFRKDQIDIVRKGNKQDTINVAPSSLEDLKEYLDVRKERYKATDSDVYVFLTKVRGKAHPISVRSIQEAIKKYTEAFGKALSPHKLRHTFASEWLRNGGELVLLRDQLGHNSIETTVKYTNLDNEEAKKIIQKIDEVMDRD